MSSFQFKQFKVSQERAAMKVGTDGVLLGAWADVNDASSILDIGSGTGLISLMLAQRNNYAKITAIEIDKNASLETKLNFENSAWSDRLQIFNKNIADFGSITKFDFIISNPPFFNNSFKANSLARNTARQTDSLSFDLLLSKTASLLSNQGKAAFILPFHEEQKFLELAQTKKLILQRRTRIRGNENTDIKRSMLEFSFEQNEFVDSELVIEISRHQYTSDYIELVKDFYLKM